MTDPPHAADCTLGKPRRVAVLGGGISGLAAAHRLRELDSALEVHLIERSERLGGVLRTEHRDGYLLEHSADNFITNAPWATALCRRLGLEQELISTNEHLRRAFVLRQGRLLAVPAGFQLLAPQQFWPLLTSPLLSWRGKLRLLAECLIPAKRDAADESLADFARRRLGTEAYQRLVQPLVGGIYTANAEHLSMQAALPRFVEMERRHGSLIRAMRKQRAAQPVDQASGARYGLFMTPRQGVESLVQALAGKLPPGSIHLGQAVSAVRPLPGNRWQLELAADPDSASPGGATSAALTQPFGALLCALPAPAAAAVLAPLGLPLTEPLSQIPYAGCALVLWGCRADQIGRPLEGFGLVVPEIERRRILAVSQSSNKFPHRAPENHVLLRIFVGGAQHPELVELDDQALHRLVHEELADLLDFQGQPELFQVQRWRQAMPQYHLGHRERVQQIVSTAAAWPTLALAGNAYRGVGIPDCIRTAEQAAEQLLAGCHTTTPA